MNAMKIVPHALMTGVYIIIVPSQQGLPPSLLPFLKSNIVLNPLRHMSTRELS